MCQQHPQFLTAYRLHMHRTIKPRPHHLRYAARIVAVRLVDLRLQHRLHVPRLNADHRQSCFGESAEQPLRQRSSFQPNSLEVVGEVLQHRQQRFRFARHLHFPNDLACVVHNADARLLDRYVQSSKMAYAALLLLMLEAVTTDLVPISLKRSTPNLQLSTSCWPITPSFGRKRRFDPLPGTSGLPPLATELRTSRIGSFVPPWADMPRIVAFITPLSALLRLHRCLPPGPYAWHQRLDRLDHP